MGFKGITDWRLPIEGGAGTATHVYGHMRAGNWGAPMGSGK
jgi:hypothetical protein